MGKNNTSESDVVSGRSSEKLTKDWFLKRRSVAFLRRSKPEKNSGI